MSAGVPWRRDVGLLALLGALALARPVACGSGGGGPADPAVLAVLADVGPEVVIPRLAEVQGRTVELAATVAHWANTDDGLEREAARLAFVEAVGLWEELEVMQLGPAAGSLDAVGGLDLRDEILSWPTVNPCRIDQLTVQQAYEDATFFEDNLVTSWGIDALDRLLFAPDDANACGPDIDLNVDGSWDGLGEDEIARRRADYAVVVADRLVEDLDRLVEAWDPHGGDFGAVLATAGEDGSPYESADEALGAVFGALFYLESATQDRKLGRVLGLRDCAEEACPDDAELPWSDGSHLWIAANLRGFRALFTGGDGQGLDDLLRERGEADTADAVLTALDAADTAAAGLTVPVEEAATGDRAAALAVHAALVEVTTLLESDVATALRLQIPSDVAGDVD